MAPDFKDFGQGMGYFGGLQIIYNCSMMTKVLPTEFYPDSICHY
jgi:hypothetical protein